MYYKNKISVTMCDVSKGGGWVRGPYKSTYFQLYSCIKIKLSSQVNFLAYYGSTNQSINIHEILKFKNFLIRFGTVRLKWKTGFTLLRHIPYYFFISPPKRSDFYAARTVLLWRSVNSSRIRYENRDAPMQSGIV